MWTKDETALHMECVESCRLIAEKLNEGCTIDVQLTYSGGCLHDIGKEKESCQRRSIDSKKFGYPYLLK